MKKLSEYIDKTLIEEVETITATELRKNIGECLTQASLGKSFCIKRKGEIVAFLVNYSSTNLVADLEGEFHEKNKCG